VGINYDKDTKQHSCVIEQYQKWTTTPPISDRGVVFI
jgi:hypothetical protein